MTLIRVLRTAQVTLSHTFFVDGDATAPTGTLQAAVKRAADGTTVAGSPFTYTVSGTTCSFALPAQAQLDKVTVDWSGTIAGATVTARDFVEIVGGFFFGLTEVKVNQSYTTDDLAAARIEVEDECERICRRAFVPRFEYEQLVGSGTARLGTIRNELRTLRAVIVDGVAWSAPDVAAVIPLPHGVLRRPGGALWPADASIVVEYEHGWDYPPPGIVTAAKRRMKSLLTGPSSGVPERAQSFTSPEGGIYRLSMPDDENTGIPDVDAAYHRWARRRKAVFA